MVLTRRQRQVADFIVGFIREQGYSPSFQEIAQGLGLNSIATVHKHITALKRKGFLQGNPNSSRSLEAGPKYLQELRRARQGQSSLAWPLLGRIAAGKPIEALEQRELLSLADMAGQKEVFVLQVKGDSMKNDHILDGDYVLVEKVPTANDGDVVVALIDGSETTLKRLYREPQGRIRLQPANAQMKPIVVPAGSVTIQGRVIGVLRRY